MAQTPEKWVKGHVRQILEQHKVKYTMAVTMGFGKSGDPDYITCLAGLYVTIEAKDDALRHRRGELKTRGKNKGTVVTAGGPTALQQTVMGEIRDSWGITLLIDRHNFTALHDFIIHVNSIAGYIEWTDLRDGVITRAKELDLWYDRMPEL